MVCMHPFRLVLQNLTHPSSVTLGGAALFLCFGIIYIYEASQSTIDFDDYAPHEHILRD